MIKDQARKLVNRLGYDVTPITPPDMDGWFLNTYRRCREYTVTSIERMFALCEAVRYIVSNRIDGDIVECGVWKGGSMMLCAEMLQSLGDLRRELYLYDTFAGMSEPTDKDVNYKGEKAVKRSFDTWCNIPLDAVRRNMYLTGYPRNRIAFVEGKVEDTIPRIMPSKIALLRLDTDFYESTYHEMVHLLPRLVNGGVLIIDDYGHFKGAREAVDKYIRENKVRILLNRIDYTGRIGIKMDGDR